MKLASLSPNIVTPAVSSELGLELEVLYCPRMILSIVVHHHITYNQLLPLITSWISPMCCPAAGQAGHGLMG